MRIKVLLNLGAGLPRFMSGEIHEVTAEVGRMLVDHHWAIELPAEAIVPRSELDPLCVPELSAPAEPDKFDVMRQHPDHLTQKTSSRRKRAAKLSTEEGA